MKEKELRIALVCYGGVSLVLYMHGTIKEFLKVLRASKAYHSLPDASERQNHTFESATGPSERVHDTEHVYFDLLKAIGRDLNLKIVIDSIAGASAGGISGIVLARALAHDLSIDHLRNLWLDEADVMRLINASPAGSPLEQVVSASLSLDDVPVQAAGISARQGDPEESFGGVAVALVPATLRRGSFSRTAVRWPAFDAAGEERAVVALARWP